MSSSWPSGAFRGAARASMNPTFVDQCLDLTNPVHWKNVGPLSLHFFPDGHDLRATIAWLNEVFAHVFPGPEEDLIKLGYTSEEAVSNEYRCRVARIELARRLAEYLNGKMREREGWARKAEADCAELGAIIAAS